MEFEGGGWRAGGCGNGSGVGGERCRNCGFWRDTACVDMEMAVVYWTSYYFRNWDGEAIERVLREFGRRAVEEWEKNGGVQMG